MENTRDPQEFQKCGFNVCNRRCGFNVCNRSCLRAENNETNTSRKFTSRKQWQEAMYEELNALIENRTWEITEFSKGKKPIDSKKCYRIKLNFKGEIERY